MDKILQGLRKRLLLNKEVLIILSPHFNSDSLLASVALFSSLKKIANEGPVFNVIDLLITNPLTSVQKNFLDNSTLKYLKTTLESKNYIISIPKDGKVSKVKWREENDYFKLFLTPAYGDLSIKDLKFEQIGTSYKYVIMVGFDKLEDLGDVYINNKSFFDRVPKAILGADGDKIEDNLISISYQNSVTKVVFELLKILNVRFDSDVSQLLLNGYVESVEGLLGNIKDKSILRDIVELMDSGALMKQIGTKTSSKGSYGQLQLNQRLFANIKQNSSGILWSVVSNQELKNLQIDDAEINIHDHISFNSYQGYNNAFVLYEFSDGSVWGKVETEDLDLPKILKDFEMTVCQDGLVIRSDDTLDSVEKQLLKLLGGEDVIPTVLNEVDVEKEYSNVDSVEVVAPIEENSLPNDIEIFDSPTLQSVVNDEDKLIKHSDIDENKSEEFSDSPIISSSESFGPPKIFSSSSFGGPFSGLNKDKQ